MRRRAYCLHRFDPSDFYGCIFAATFDFSGEDTVKSTVRNRLEGEVINIVKGGAVAEVDVQTAAGVVSSVITTRSLEETGLKIGDKVVAGFKSTMVFLDKV
jgi:molybdopterin-binding protein